MPLGRILVDDRDHWIYDGSFLDIEVQEEVAGQITGHQQAMAELLRTIEIHVWLDGAAHTIIKSGQTWLSKESDSGVPAGLFHAIAKAIILRFRI